MAAFLCWAFFLFFILPLASTQFAYSPKSPLCVLENERSAIYLSMPENMPKGSILANLPIAGLASGQQANIRLSLIGGRDFVRLNALNKQLVLRKAVDREEGVARIEAIVECIPLSSQKHGHFDAFFPLNISIFIAVTDVNDNAPKFAKGGQFSVNLPEELPQGTPIPLYFTATDRDQPGPNSHIHYRIVQALSDQSEEDHSSLLTIPDPFRPELFVAGRIDFERMPKFMVLIEAEDQGSPRLRSMAQLEINVLDQDDLNPVFSSPIYTARELRGIHLAIEPGPIRAWDADVGFNETIVFGLFGEHSLNYAIDALDGTIRLLADRIVPANLLIVASQLNRPERNATAFLLIEPIEEEKTNLDEQQSHGGELFIQKIPANLAIGTELFGADLIGGGDANLKLELLDQKNHFISMDSASKSIRLARKLSVGTYEAEILAKPFSGRLPSSIRRIHLRLIVFAPAEWAQQLPAFEQAKYAFELDWNSLGGHLDGERGQGENEEEFVRIGQIRMKNLDIEERRSEVKENGGEEKSAAENEEEDGQGFGGEGGGGFVFTLLDAEEESNFDIGMESGILRMRNPLMLQNSSISRSKPTQKLFIMAEDAEGRRNFAECIVQIRGHPLENARPAKGAECRHQLADIDENAAVVGGLSPTHFLGALCFLLLLTNCATLSLWLGRKQQFSGNLYDNLSYRYDSMNGIKGGKCGQLGKAAAAADCWMLNRALEGDSAVKITKNPPRDFFTINNGSIGSFEKMAAGIGGGGIFANKIVDAKTLGKI